MVQLPGLAQRLELRPLVLRTPDARADGRIVGAAEVRGREGEVAQREAPQVSEFPVLREETRAARGLGEGRHATIMGGGGAVWNKGL